MISAADKMYQAVRTLAYAQVADGLGITFVHNDGVAVHRFDFVRGGVVTNQPYMRPCLCVIERHRSKKTGDGTFVSGDIFYHHVTTERRDKEWALFQS